MGRKNAQKLKALGILNALELSKANIKMLRQRFNVIMERTAFELRGIPCLELEDSREISKSIVSSRSFGKPVYSLQELEEAVSCFTARACQKLRTQSGLARYIQVYVTTSRFKPGRYSNAAAGTTLEHPSSDTSSMLKSAMSCLKSIYIPNLAYAKASVMWHYIPRYLPA